MLESLEDTIRGDSFCRLTWNATSPIRYFDPELGSDQGKA